MSENTNYKTKYLDGEGVRFLWTKAKSLFVKKEAGKGLSTNDFTDEYKEKIDTESAAIDGKVDKEEGKGLSSNDYTDEDKDKVAAAITDISGKVDKEEGKGLSSNDYTSEEKDKLAGLENYELPNASAETLGGIKVGAGLSIEQDGTVSVTSAGSVEWDDIQDLPSTLEGYGITDAVSDDELSAAVETIGDNISALDDKIEEVREEVSKVYKYKGTVATVAALDNIVEKNNGDVYDVLENGMNYAWNSDENRWDNLGAFFEIESITEEELDLITGAASTESSLKKLIAEGGDIDLDADITLTEALNVTKDTVLDLAGNNLASNLGGYALVANGAKLTLKGGNVNVAGRVAQAENGGEVIIESGTYNAGDVALSAIGAGSKVTFNGGELTAVEGGIGSFDGASIEVNGGTIKGTDNFPLFTNGTAGRGGNTITFNDGYLEGNITSNNYEACGVYIANNDTFIMNGGKIVANDGCGILMRAGTVTINGGEVECYKKDVGSHSPGWVGDNKTKMSASAVIYHESANYPGKAGMSLTITGGTFKGADHALEILSNEAVPNVTVTGGSFEPDFPET